jgi:hypothetical protein
MAPVHGAGGRAEAPVTKVTNVVIHVTEPPKPPTHPCLLGAHRWAWRVDGEQECPRCGTVRR